MKISIIVPAYNEEKNIGQCLESLVDQNFDEKEYEIILVNNYSIDKTKDIALNFSKVKLIDEPKQGYVHALIRGCKEARGEIFVFTDADAIVPKQWLNNYWQVYQNKEIVAAGGPARFSPANWQTRLIEPFIRSAKIINGFNFSIRREIYLKFNGFSPNINFNADTYLLIQARKFGQISFLKENQVVVSNRRFRSLTTLPYITKSALNCLCLLLFKKTLFYNFENIRE